MSLLDAPDSDVLLLSEAPDVEREALVASLRLVHRLLHRGEVGGGEVGGGEVIVASPHPAADWMDPLDPYGVDHVWVLTPAHERPAGQIGKVLDMVHGVCPFLHSETEEGVTLSVCGCRHDRAVLARSHLERWCLRGGRDCPHRCLGGADG